MKKTKHFLSLVLILAILLTISSNVLASEKIKVMVNGSAVSFDVQPTTINGRTMVPVRFIAEKLGATVIWDETTQSVTATKGSTVIKITVDQSMMQVNGSSIPLDAPATVIEARTLVPVRAIGEAFGCQIDWDDKNKIVSIITSDKDMYQVYVDFVKTNGSYNEGKYGIQSEIPYYSGDSGDSYGTITLLYDPDVKELQLQVYEVYESNTGDSTTVLFLVVDLPQKSNTYDWQFQYGIYYPSYSKYDDYFMAAEGTFKSNVDSYLDDDSVHTSEIIIGREITRGRTATNVGMLLELVNIYGNDIFNNKGSSLSFDYFGIK